MVYLHDDEWSMWVWDFKCIQLYRFDVDGYVTRKCDHYNTIKGDIKEHCAKYFFSLWMLVWCHLYYIPFDILSGNC